LFAAATGVWFHLNLVEIGAALENFAPPSGRMNLVEGIKNSLIIDDTYNSSPAASMAALEVMREIKNKRRIVVFGDMLELGVETETEHKNIAKEFMQIKGDIFFGVGQRMQFATNHLSRHNFPKEKIFSFSNPMDVGKKLQEIIQADDLILVKGSQSMRMEKVVEEIMAYPQKSDELLCRQNKEWKNIPFREV
jgi:UDP-N-acetylmuramoyl-tripeptide--D-alanyl-D-alanine ligase